MVRLVLKLLIILIRVTARVGYVLKYRAVPKVASRAIVKSAEHPLLQLQRFSELWELCGAQHLRCSWVNLTKILYKEKKIDMPFKTYDEQCYIGNPTSVNPRYN